MNAQVVSGCSRTRIAANVLASVASRLEDLWILLYLDAMASNLPAMALMAAASTLEAMASNLLATYDALDLLIRADNSEPAMDAVR